MCIRDSYHTGISPNLFTDADGRYLGMDLEVHQGDTLNPIYTVFSLWDTFRALHPLMTIIDPDLNNHFINSLIKKHQEGGIYPMWDLASNYTGTMIGYHAVPVIVDAYMKGYRNFDAKEAYKACLRAAEYDTTGIKCPDLVLPHLMPKAKYYKNAIGYIPCDRENESVAKALEYAYDDWTIYQTALKSGKKEIAETYRKRALNYRNIYDTMIGFARPRFSDGSFKKDFDVLQTYGEGFIEGNSWNFSFHVPHDVFGMMDLMGGERVFVDKLDKLFSMHLPEKYYEHNEDITEECLVGGYVHGNEPSHHIPYLYAWTSEPWKTQYWLREILNKMYRNDINGLGGNDDCGQMSAWYLFSVMGFYPVCPGTDEYVLGAPYLPYLKLKLPNGNTLEIKAPGVSDKKRYVQSLKLNGKVYDKMYITHEDILKGGVLEFKMSASPNKRRGLTKEDKPYSLTDGINK